MDVTDLDLDPDDPRVAYVAARDARRRRATIGLVLGCIGALVAVIVISSAIDSGDSQSSRVLPGGVFTTLDGEQFDLIELRGEPTVVNFFASWCAPCRAEMPDFEKVHQLRGDEVQFVGINASETNIDDAIDLVDVTGVTYLVLLGGDAELLETLGGTDLPMTVFIDADGRVTESHTGTLHADTLDAKIDELLRR